ncbi:sensor histidine kinase [Trichloromonas sp.]|uniref:sensor histidine kinase n=1 Tax=Trichloromonas sp. TaxID=3069249 RepID=UPI002A4831BE|nr:heavy metal sensor histidine kinase [Trichloromonas sp.]
MPGIPCPGSVRFRLTFWYVVTLAVILTASGTYWYWTLSRNLLGQVDAMLMMVAKDVIAFHLAESQRNNPEEACQKLESFIREHNWSEFVQFVDQHGDIVCHTSNLLNARLPISAEALRSARGHQPFFETVRFNDDRPVRLLTFPLGSDSHHRDVVQVAEDLGPLYKTLRVHRWQLSIYSPLLLLVLSIGGWFVTGRALSPVRHITGTVKRISAENLSERLPVNSCRDEVSELQETFNSMLTRLEEAFTKIRQFSADASHELRTPLAILRGETEVALRWAKSPEELRTTLESNLEEIDRMSRIIEELLALAKSEAGEIPLALTDVNLNDLMQDLYLQGKTLSEPKGIEFTLHMEVNREIRLSGDQLQLHRMLLNLISNAVKYTPEGGRVAIHLASDGGQARIQIIDTGFGIAAEHLPHLFDRFYRIDEARNRDIGGSGLGLAIVKWIVEAHGGHIEVASEPNRGSTFTVTLPLTGPSPKKKKLS